MHRILLLILLSHEISSTENEQKDPCANCGHDYVKVCGVRDDSVEVAFRLFQDECALQKYTCQKEEMKGFRLVNMDYCKQVFSKNQIRNKNSTDSYSSVEDSKTEEPGAVNSTTSEDTVTTDHSLTYTSTSTNVTCIQCNCNSNSKPICAMRAKGKRFIIRWFADECHVLQYNCENNVNFFITDNYICEVDKNSSKGEIINDNTDEKLAITTEEIEINEFLDGPNKTDFSENLTCIQHNCTYKSKVICAMRQEDERFIHKYFNDECEMLQYNCENEVNFTITNDLFCSGNENFTKDKESNEDIITVISDNSTNVLDTYLSEITEKAEESEDRRALSKEDGNTFKENSSFFKSAFPKNVVVSTVDITEDINKTIENFFAASHLGGIPIQKLEDSSRRMIIKDTGPVNLFVPRAFVPANYTPVELRNESKQFPEYSPLVKYCYHKCPEKCPEFYKPVCGARIDKTKQTPFVFFRNHCYMDKAKCMIKWAGYKDKDYTELEEMGFVFCGGYKLMNTMYMFPLMRILQKMGRLKKKGKIKFLMRDLGRYSVPLQG